MDETFPDLGSLSDQELKDVIQQLTEEELEVQVRRGREARSLALEGAAVAVDELWRTLP